VQPRLGGTALSKQSFIDALKRRILIMDGAMGTMLQEANLTAIDFGGDELEGCNEHLNITSPSVIKSIHEKYLESGADIIETNTFGATSIVLEEYGIGHKAYEINKIGAQLAKQATELYSTSEHPRFVAGSMGPTTKSLSITGGTTFEELSLDYEKQATGLIDGGVDILLLETSQDMLNVKAGYVGIQSAFKKTGKTLPIIVSGTIEPMGTTLSGQSIEAFYISVEHMNPVAVGLNCATGPEFMQEHIRSLSELAQTAVSCYPNAGLPDEEGHYHESPESLANKLSGFAEKGWLNIVGGCCGTTPQHIKAISTELSKFKPRIISTKPVHKISGIEAFIYDDPTLRPIMVGERTNVIGSRKFKRLITEGKYDEAAEIARAQVKGGAHVIDICLANPDRDEFSDMENFLRELTKKIKAPLMIDSTDENVIKKALTFSQGKAIINSINLEEGEERFEAIAPLIHRFGAAVVVGTIDEKGMGVSKERKLEIAERSFKLLINKYKLKPQDIIFDPLVFPVGTGDEQYIGSAKATVEGIRVIKERFPEVQTILGISNVSFGLTPVGREILNSVFLYHCTLAGLDYALVNTEKLERYASIPKAEIMLAENLLFNTNEGNLREFTDFYRDKKIEVKEKNTDLPLEARLGNFIIEGSKEGLLSDLEEALKFYSTPLDIINGPLMDGMKEVGKLFNDNQLIVAEVLQSAEVMKSAVSYLETYMEKGTQKTSKGKIILATVKGDVHDIGKNLVDIILSNNGYEVVDLGVKVASNDLIQAIKKEKPDMIGLSGLLVKSAQQMVLTASDMKKSGIKVPVIVGGAALSRKFVDTKIAKEYDGLVLYAKDAMSGLTLANQIQSPDELEKLVEENGAKFQKEPADFVLQVVTTNPKQKTSNVNKQTPVFIPKDTNRHLLKSFSISHIEPYINMQMLLGHHLGVKGRIEELLVREDDKAVKVKEVVYQLLECARRENWIIPQAVYQFYPAQSEGNKVIIYQPEDHSKVIQEFVFPRQVKEPYLCIADYLKSVGSGEMDYVGIFAVTAGKGVRKKAEEFKKQGRFLESHAFSALALELAEGFAELIHRQMRDQWGFPDSVDLTMRDRFSARYQGQRFSFGYPACPNLDDQQKLFELIQPHEIGITLTDAYMMEPEASVTAMVFAHPDARYFNVL
jgi:5-methyltetrahydrofolate--homocysteine methyltransferase